MKNVKIHGIKEAMGDYHRNEGSYRVFMVDVEDGYVWLDVFFDSNSWKQYHSDTIHSMNTYFCEAMKCEYRDLRMNMENVKKTAEYVCGLYPL